MKILLILPESPFLVDSRTFPPLGLLYLGAALEDAGHEVAVADLAFGHDRLMDCPFSPDMVGIMCLTAHYPAMKALIEECRYLYDSPVVVGGPHFSTCPDDGPRVGADSVCVGDGEECIVEMARDCDSGRLKPRYQSKGGIVDVNRLPLPARHLVDIHEYVYTMDGTLTTTAISQRGCPYECTFCCHWEGYRKIRLRATDNIVKEIREVKSLGFGGLMYYDDEFNINNRRTLEVLEAIKTENIKWRAFIKANLFTAEQARAFKDAGCWEVCTGVESGSNEILQTIKKKATVADNTNARRYCREVGLRFKAFAMVGHPGETEETAEATRRWLLENRPDEFNLSINMPYLGTPVVEHPEQFDIKFDLNYEDREFFYMGKPGEFQLNVSTSGLSAQRIRELRDSIERDVREQLGLRPLTQSRLHTAPRTPDEVEVAYRG